MPKTAEPTSSVRRTWREALALYAQPASLRMLLLGFSAGLPLLLVLAHHHLHLQVRWLLAY